MVVAGQWTHEDQEQIAHSLDLPLDKIRVIYPAIGGAFGGREDMSIQIILALAVIRLHERGIDRPVKIIWTREESMIGHCKRHAYKLTVNGAQPKKARFWLPRWILSPMPARMSTPPRRSLEMRH